MFELKLYYDNNKIHYRGFTRSKKIARQFKNVVDESGVFLSHFSGNLYEYDRKGRLINKTFRTNGKVVQPQQVRYDVDKKYDQNNIHFAYHGEVDSAGNWNGHGFYFHFRYDLHDDIRYFTENLVYCGSFLDGERNGYGVLFNTFCKENAQKVYAGYWQNGKPHGNGFLFHRNGTIFLYGEWCRGKCSGCCLIFNDQRDFIFRGDWNEYEGFACLYDFHSGAVQYEGTVQNGLPNGIGTFKNYPRSNFLPKLDHQIITEYFGEIQDGLPHGFGKHRKKWADTMIYTVGWFNRGIINGLGLQWKCEDFDTSGYLGNFRQNEGSGFGIYFKGSLKLAKAFKLLGLYDWKNEIFSSNSFEEVEKVIYDRICSFDSSFRIFFRGDVEYFRHTLFEDEYSFVKGKIYYSSKADQVVQYDGEFLGDSFHGNGKLFYPCGSLCYEGEWKNDKQIGHGTYYDHEIAIPNTTKNGHCFGFGMYIRKYEDKMVYKGHLKDGLPHGEGIIYEYDCCDNIEFVFSGEFFQGKYYWEKQMFNMDHEVVFEGVCDENGSYLNGTEIITDENDNEIEINWLNGKVFDEKFHRQKSKEQLLLNSILETKNLNVLFKISKDTCIKMHKNIVKNRRSYRNISKLGIVKEIITHQKRTQNIDQSSMAEDLYGNEIVQPVTGTDGQIYDIKSMQKLFHVDDNDEYTMIVYGYSDGNERMPLFPKTGHKNVLDGFFMDPDTIYRKVKIVDEKYIYLK